MEKKNQPAGDTYLSPNEETVVCFYKSSLSYMYCISASYEDWFDANLTNYPFLKVGLYVALVCCTQIKLDIIKLMSD